MTGKTCDPSSLENRLRGARPIEHRITPWLSLTPARAYRPSKHCGGPKMAGGSEGRRFESGRPD